MRIHHSSCICTLGGHLLDGAGSRAPRDQLACHCLWLEEGGALVLVDTAYGLRDVAAPEQRLNQMFPTTRESLKHRAIAP